MRVLVGVKVLVKAVVAVAVAVGKVTQLELSEMAAQRLVTLASV